MEEEEACTYEKKDDDYFYIIVNGVKTPYVKCAKTNCTTILGSHGGHLARHKASHIQKQSKGYYHYLILLLFINKIIIEERGQEKIEKYIGIKSGQKVIEATLEEKKKITDALSNFCFMDFVPYSIVEKPGLRKVIQTAMEIGYQIYVKLSLVLI